jgi:hypothetical protein
MIKQCPNASRGDIKGCTSSISLMFKQIVSKHFGSMMNTKPGVSSPQSSPLLTPSRDEGVKSSQTSPLQVFHGPIVAQASKVPTRSKILSSTASKNPRASSRKLFGVARPTATLQSPQLPNQDQPLAPQKASTSSRLLAVTPMKKQRTQTHSSRRAFNAPFATLYTRIRTVLKPLPAGFKVKAPDFKGYVAAVKARKEREVASNQNHIRVVSVTEALQPPKVPLVNQNVTVCKETAQSDRSIALNDNVALKIEEHFLKNAYTAYRSRFRTLLSNVLSHKAVGPETLARSARPDSASHSVATPAEVLRVKRAASRNLFRAFPTRTQPQKAVGQETLAQSDHSDSAAYATKNLIGVPVFGTAQCQLPLAKKVRVASRNLFRSLPASNATTNLIEVPAVSVAQIQLPPAKKSRAASKNLFSSLPRTAQSHNVAVTERFAAAPVHRASRLILVAAPVKKVSVRRAIYGPFATLYTRIRTVVRSKPALKPREPDFEGYLAAVKARKTRADTLAAATQKPNVTITTQEDVTRAVVEPIHIDNNGSLHKLEEDVVPISTQVTAAPRRSARIARQAVPNAVAQATPHRLAVLKKPACAVVPLMRVSHTRTPNAVEPLEQGARTKEASADIPLRRSARIRLQAKK